MKIKLNTTQLYKSLTSLGNRLVTRASQNTAMYMHNAFLNSVDFFYSSYEPMKYSRHYFMDRGGKPVHKGGFGGIELSADSIPAAYHDSPDYVFFQSTMQGWHGGVGIRTAPSPATMLMEAVREAAENPRQFLA